MFAQFDLFFARFDWCWCSWIYFYAFRFICMQFDSFLWGSIHLCTVRFIFVPVRFNFCAVRFIFSDVRFVFTWFVSLFVVLIFHDRFSFYLCAFHIVHFGLEDFVRNGAPYVISLSASLCSARQLIKYSKPNAVRARRNAFMRNFPDFVCMPAFSCSSIHFTHFVIYRIIFGVGNFSRGFFVCGERKCSIFVSVLFCFYLLRL